MMLIVVVSVGLALVAAAVVLATVAVLRSRQGSRVWARVVSRIDRYPSETRGVALTLAALGLVLLAWPTDHQPHQNRALPPVSRLPPTSAALPPPSSMAGPPVLNRQAANQGGEHAAGDAPGVVAVAQTVSARSDDRPPVESAGPQAAATTREASPTGAALVSIPAAGPGPASSPALATTGQATMPAPPPRLLVGAGT